MAKIQIATLFRLFPFVLGFIFLPLVEAAEQHLSDAFPVKWLKVNLVSHSDFRPYPKAADRVAWTMVDVPIRDHLLGAAAAEFKSSWSVLPATRFLDYIRDGNRTRFEALYAGRRQRVQLFALAECLEGRGRFGDELVNGLWLICEESSWVLPAHLSPQKAGLGLPDHSEPIIDIFAAKTGAQLAWIQYLLGPELDRVSPLIRIRIISEIKQRILIPFLDRNDYTWMGFQSHEKLNNWTPWIVSNVLACALLAESDLNLRTQIVHRCLAILDHYFTSQTSDGCCEEGPGYWNYSAASAFDALELCYLATGGKMNGFSGKLIAMGRYIYCSQISDEWFMNFADSSARPEIDGPLCFRFGERIGDSRLGKFGAWHAQHSRKLGSGDNLGRIIPAILRSREILAADAALPMPKSTWWPDVQIMASRSESGTAKGFYLAAKGGHNAESHNHNDIGTCIVFADGRPVLIDSGPGAYTRGTFGKQRYDYWPMQSSYHNLPTINGFPQAFGAEFRSRAVVYHNTNGTTSFSIDLAGAYPPSVKVKQWTRQYVYSRPDLVKITDNYLLAAASSQTRWHFIFPVEPEQETPGQLKLYTKSARPVTIEFDPSLNIQVEAVDTDDPSLRVSWGKQIYRVTLTESETRLRGSFTMSISMK